MRPRPLSPLAPLVATCLAVGLTAGLAACAVSITDDTVFNAPESVDDASLAVLGVETLPADVIVTNGSVRGPSGRIAYTWAKKADATGAQRPVALVCMGNSANRHDDAINYADDLLPYADVLTFDYPGYGDSDGEATVANLESAVGVMLDTLPSLGVTSDRKVFGWGHSLGGFVCAQMAGRSDRLDGLALVATLGSTQQVAKAFTPWYAGPFVRYDIQDGLEGYDTVASLKAFKGPIVYLTPGDDKLFPPREQTKVADALKAQGNDAEQVMLPGGGHSHFDHLPEFQAAIPVFIARVTAPRS